MATQKQTANVAMQPSPTAYAALRRYEKTKYEYYPDPAHNCTWGIGFLAHRGPCTPEENKRVVTPAQVNAELAVRVNEAAAAVRRQVHSQPLTQAQFDALVTYTYNRGAAGAHPVLQAANQGDNAAVVSIMNRNVHVRRNNHIETAHGLVVRRVEESAPFRPQQQQ